MITKIKGTQDFLDLTLFNFITNHIRAHVGYYHFSEIATPIIEPLALFERSLGQETDVISKEMFLIEAQEGKSRICLRPEGTAPTVRAFIEHNISTIPWKVFSCGPMFRHERPQKGRYRQFNQATIEIIGTSAIAQDAQLLAMLDRLFSEVFTLDNYALLINFLGCADDRQSFKKILYSFLEQHTNAICKNCTERKEKNILRVFDCKNPDCKKIYQDAPKIADHLCKPCDTEWQELQQLLALLSVPFCVKPSLVRGLDYYGKTVFEFVSADLGAQDAFCAGGRYDKLVKELGGKHDQPSIGAAIGIERLMLLLEPIQDRLLIPQRPALHAIIPMSEAQQGLAVLLADELQAAKLCTDVLYEGSLKSRMRRANKMGATYVLLLGDDEQANRQVTVKHMTTGTEQLVDQAKLLTLLRG